MNEMENYFIQTNELIRSHICDYLTLLFKKRFDHNYYCFYSINKSAHFELLLMK